MQYTVVLFYDGEASTFSTPHSTIVWSQAVNNQGYGMMPLGQAIEWGNRIDAMKPYDVQFFGTSERGAFVHAWEGKGESE